MTQTQNKCTLYLNIYITSFSKHVRNLRKSKSWCFFIRQSRMKITLHIKDYFDNPQNDMNGYSHLVFFLYTYNIQFLKENKIYNRKVL